METVTNVTWFHSFCNEDLYFVNCAKKRKKEKKKLKFEFIQTEEIVELETISNAFFFLFFSTVYRIFTEL